MATDVQPIKTSGDAQRLRQTPWAAGKVLNTRSSTAALHGFDAFERFDRAQQNSGADAARFARDIEHVMRAIDKVDVRVAVVEKKSAVPRSRPVESVAGRIAGEIAFCFDDAPAQAAARQVVDNRLTDQEARKLHCVVRKPC